MLDQGTLSSTPSDTASVSVCLRKWKDLQADHVHHIYECTDILINPGACQGIVDKANLRSTDKVLEVGPGTGNLTTLILPKCKTLLAVEA